MEAMCFSSLASRRPRETAPFRRTPTRDSSNPANSRHPREDGFLLRNAGRLPVSTAVASPPIPGPNAGRSSVPRCRPGCSIVSLFDRVLLFSIFPLSSCVLPISLPSFFLPSFPPFFSLLLPYSLCPPSCPRFLLSSLLPFSFFFL